MMRTRSKLLIATVLPLLASCGAVVRDRGTYAAEVAFHESIEVQAGTALLRLAPTSSTCAKLAGLGLVLTVRAPYHAAMARHLAGMTEVAPGLAPAVPSSSTICTGGVR